MRANAASSRRSGHRYARTVDFDDLLLVGLLRIAIGCAVTVDSRMAGLRPDRAGGHREGGISKHTHGDAEVVEPQLKFPEHHGAAVRAKVKVGRSPLEPKRVRGK